MSPCSEPDEPKSGGSPSENVHLVLGLVWHRDRVVQPADVPSDHDFFDPAYVRRWAGESIRKNPQRPAFFDAFVKAIDTLGREVVVLEFGSGPGFLAERILGHCQVAAYYLVDFSPEMHELSRQRLAQHSARTVFVEGDFRDPGWPDFVPTPADVAVSLQALHEVRHVDRVPRFYRQVRSVLRRNGLILVCDHLRPDADARPLFMSVDEHLAALAAGGLTDAKLVLEADGMAMFSATNPGP
jgi:SAM-dependent methyltransferase